MQFQRIGEQKLSILLTARGSTRTLNKNEEKTNKKASVGEGKSTKKYIKSGSAFATKT